MSLDLVNKIFTWTPAVFVFLVLGIISFYFIKREKFDFPPQSFYWYSGISLVLFKILYALSVTISQYSIWSGHKFSKFLLPPHQPISYLLNYTWQRVWLEVLVSIGIAFLFYSFLKFLKKKNSRFFKKGEEELGFVTSLIAGWPGLLIYLPIVFLLVISISFLRKVFSNKKYTPLGPFLLFGGWIAFFGTSLILEIFNLELLQL